MINIKQKNEEQLSRLIVADIKSLVSLLPCRRDDRDGGIQKPLRTLVSLDFKVKVFFQHNHLFLFVFCSYLQQGIFSQA